MPLRRRLPPGPSVRPWPARRQPSSRRCLPGPRFPTAAWPPPWRAPAPPVRRPHPQVRHRPSSLEHRTHVLRAVSSVAAFPVRRGRPSAAERRALTTPVRRVKSSLPAVEPRKKAAVVASTSTSSATPTPRPPTSLTRFPPTPARRAWAAFREHTQTAAPTRPSEPGPVPPTHPFPGDPHTCRSRQRLRTVSSSHQRCGPPAGPAAVAAGARAVFG